MLKQPTDISCPKIELDLLKQVIKEKSTNTDVARVLNITYVGFLNKLQGENSFKWEEVLKIKKYLQLTDEEFNKIFPQD